MKIKPTADSGFTFEAAGEDADLTGTVNPVGISLVIGNDNGAVNVTAELAQHGEEGDQEEEEDVDD